MEYIRKQSLLADLNETTPHSYFAFETMVREYPTEDVAPVVHAHWIEDCGDYKCSHCSTEFWDEIVFIVRTSEHEFPNYCPYCGAKMDEEVKTDEQTAKM